MGAKYPWIELKSGLSAAQVDRELDDMKNFKVYISQKKHRCTVCPENVNSHYMWYRVMLCASETCTAACEWPMKLLTCLEMYDEPTPATSTTRNISMLYQQGEHEELARSPPRTKMKRAVKRFVQERTAVGARPARVHAEVANKFLDIQAARLPTLKQVQNLSRGHKKKVLLQDAAVRHMVELVERYPRHGAQASPSAPYAFGFDRDVDGRPKIGRGTDGKPTLVGITTRAMIGRLRVARNRMLHIDATFKLNESGYPVIIVGISDRARTFHPIVFFLSSQLQAVHYERVIARLLDEYEQWNGEAPVIGSVMTDADDALYNAIDAVFIDRRLQQPQHVMCFFHVMMNVKKRAVELSKTERRRVKDLIYDMHFARDEQEFQQYCDEAASTWTTSPALKVFHSHFKKQWLDSRFSRWQCFWSESGEAKTNNPVEQFNRVIKRDFTLGVLTPMTTMLEKLFTMARAKATYQIDVVHHRMPVDGTMDRYRYLQKGGLIHAIAPQRGSMSFLLHGEASKVCVFQSDIVDRNLPLPAKKSSGEKFYCSKLNMRQNKFEMRAQPADSWAVDTSLFTCACKICFKFGFCAHIVVALKVCDLQMPGREEEEVFFNRRVRAARSTEGRPKKVGHALSLV